MTDYISLKAMLDSMASDPYAIAPAAWAGAMRQAPDAIEALEKERDEARDTVIEMTAGRYTPSEVIQALVKAGFK